MNNLDLHALTRQNIAAIHYLEKDTSESIEGECHMWTQDDCTILIDWEKLPEDSTQIVESLKYISDKLTHLNTQQSHISQWLTQAHTLPESTPLRMIYITFFIDNTQHVYTDFAVAPESNHEHTIELSLDSDNILHQHYS